MNLRSLDNCFNDCVCKSDWVQVTKLGLLVQHEENSVDKTKQDEQNKRLDAHFGASAFHICTIFHVQRCIPVDQLHSDVLLFKLITLPIITAQLSKLQNI